jgi:hypothetical protein
MNCKPAIKSVEMTHNCNRKAKSAIAAIALLASALMLSNDQALARGESVLRGGHAENYGGRASYGSPLGVGRGFSHLAVRPEFDRRERVDDPYWSSCNYYSYGGESSCSD